MPTDHDDLLLQDLLQSYFKNGRSNKNHSQEKLDGLSGVSVGTISRIERKQTIPQLKMMFFHLVIALDLDANAIITEYKAKSKQFNQS